MVQIVNLGGGSVSIRLNMCQPIRVPAIHAFVKCQRAQLMWLDWLACSTLPMLPTFTYGLVK